MGKTLWLLFDGLSLTEINKWEIQFFNNNNNNNNINNNNNNNDNKNNNNNRVYPNPCSGQRALALINWLEQAVILCGGTKAQK